MPYITPDSTPVDTICWRIFVPNDVKIRAAILGQLLELTERFNWEQTTGITVDETISIFDDIFSNIEIGECRLLGSLVHYVTDNPPNHVLECDGAGYLRVDYPALYAVLPASLIDGADNFHVPDLQDIFLLGAGVTFPVENVGGETDHVLNEGEIPAHTHGYFYPGASIDFHTAGVPDVSAVANPPTGLVSTSAGGGLAHNNMPPYVAYKIGIVAK